MLKKLCNDGFLSSAGNGRGTKYHINVDANNDSNSPNNDSNSSNNDSNSSNNDSNSSNNDSKKLTFEQLELHICAILGDKFMSVEQIAQKINRSVSHLKNIIIPRLIDRGSIVRQFPDTPRHPQQKFKATNKTGEEE